MRIQIFGPSQELRTAMWVGGGSNGKKSACNAGNPGSIPESGRSWEKEMATQSSILAWKIP